MFQWQHAANLTVAAAPPEAWMAACLFASWARTSGSIYVLQVCGQKHGWWSWNIMKIWHFKWTALISGNDPCLPNFAPWSSKSVLSSKLCWNVGRSALATTTMSRFSSAHHSLKVTGEEPLPRFLDTYKNLSHLGTVWCWPSSNCSFSALPRFAMRVIMSATCEIKKKRAANSAVVVLRHGESCQSHGILVSLVVIGFSQRNLWWCILGPFLMLLRPISGQGKRQTLSW